MSGPDEAPRLSGLHCEKGAATEARRWKCGQAVVDRLRGRRIKKGSGLQCKGGVLR